MLVVDIETIPREDLEPSHIKAYMERKKLENIQDLSISPAMSQICTIGYADKWDNPQAIYGTNEKELLIEFANVIEEGAHSTFVGHNIKGFDLPTLAFRYAANRLHIPDPLCIAGKKPWEITHIDTMEVLQFGKGQWIALHDACIAFGLTSLKGEIRGSNTYEAYQAGKLKEIAEYCKDDVTATYKLYMVLQKVGAI